jgi:hypothetical protein
MPSREFAVFQNEADQAKQLSGVFRRIFELELELNQESRDSRTEAVELEGCT